MLAAQMSRCILLALCLTLAACASRPLPKYEKPLARAAVQAVRTTAYTHTESDHTQYARRTALGTQLQYGAIRSAAADWSRWPSGTVFRIKETGEIREVDDYGWALSGTNTIDLYQPTRGMMNSWGVKRVNIEILRWGDPWQSHAVLRPRSKYAHVKRMLRQIEDRYSRGRTEPRPVIPDGEFMLAGGPTPTAIPSTRPALPSAVPGSYSTDTYASSTTRPSIPAPVAAPIRATSTTSTTSSRVTVRQGVSVSSGRSPSPLNPFYR